MPGLPELAQGQAEQSWLWMLDAAQHALQAASNTPDPAPPHTFPAPPCDRTRGRRPGPHAEGCVYFKQKGKGAVSVRDRSQLSKSLPCQTKQTTMRFRKLLRHPWSPLCPASGCHGPPRAELIPGT